MLETTFTSLTSERLRTSLSQKIEEIYLVKAGNQVLYMGRDFNLNQKWLTDKEFHKVMGWDRVQVKKLKVNPISTKQIKQPEELESPIDLF